MVDSEENSVNMKPNIPSQSRTKRMSKLCYYYKKTEAIKRRNTSYSEQKKPSKQLQYYHCQWLNKNHSGRRHTDTDINLLVDDEEYASDEDIPADVDMFKNYIEDGVHGNVSEQNSTDLF